MSTFAQLRAAVSTALGTITGLRAVPYLKDQVVPPPGGGFAMVEFDDIPDYDLVFGQVRTELPLIVTVFAPREQAEASQVFLDTLRDPHAATGIKPVLQGNAGIAALCDYLKVKGCTRPSVTSIGAPGVEYLVVEFQCEVVN